MDVEAIEHALQELGMRLDLPFSSRGDPDEVCMALGRRARDLHRGYVTCKRAGEWVAARVLLRPAAETNILLRFIRESPEHRAKLWQAETTRTMIRLAGHAADRPLPPNQELQHLPSGDDLGRLRDDVAQVRADAIAAGVKGVPKSGALIPGAYEQAVILNTPEVWQAYVVAYLPLNSEMHVGHFSFQEGFRHELPDGTVIHHSIENPKLAERALASSVFASTLVIVSSWLSLGIEDPADRLRAFLVSGRPG